MTRICWMTFGLLLITAAVYWPIQHYGFVDYDDGPYVYANPHVQAGFSHAEIKWAFTTFRVGNWNPLLWFSFFTDSVLFHLHPQAMHVENVLLHLLGGILLWRLLYLATAQLELSFVVAALFLVHPMHVESVAWISERKDVLSTPLLLGAIIAYLHYVREANRTKKWLRYGLMILLFVLSLMAKSMGVTLPALLLLLDFWPLCRRPATSRGRLFAEKLPLFAISICLMLLAGRSQSVAGATPSLQEISILDRVDNAAVCYVIYVAKLVVPINLAVFYQHPGSRPLAQSIAAAGLLGIATLLMYRSRTKFPYLITGWLWFLGTLIPVIGLVQIGGQAMADRYSYLPSIGLFFAAVWWVNAVVKNHKAELAIILITLLSFGLIARRQVTFWQDSRTLFTHAAQVTDDNPVAHNILAALAMNQHDLKLAVDEYNLALRHGDNARALNGLGNCWVDTDRDKAIRYYRRAIALDTYPASFHINLAAALRLNGQLSDARQEVQTALQLDPGNAAALLELEKIDRDLSHPRRSTDTTPQ